MLAVQVILGLFILAVCVVSPIFIFILWKKVGSMESTIHNMEKEVWKIKNKKVDVE